jgi:hypothetical protein
MKEQINTLLQKIGLKAVEFKLEQMKLDDGQTTIEAEVFEAGQPVVIVTEDEQRIALPVGEYTLEDGKMLVVQEEGIIFEIKEVEEMPAEEEAPAEAEVAQTQKPTATPVAKKVVEAVTNTRESYFSSDIPTGLVEAIGKIVESKLIELQSVKQEEEVVEMAKAIKHNPEPKGERKMYIGDGTMIEYLNSLKK